jgi:predicted PurR-regulated permease PerM
LIIGGIIAWVLAIGAVYVNYDYQMLFGAAAILVSYIIPAYMLRFRNKHSNA